MAVAPTQVIVVSATLSGQAGNCGGNPTLCGLCFNAPTRLPLGNASRRGAG
jgi:hypothetical protein